MSKKRYLKFKGYGDVTPYYGDLSLTIDKVYEVIGVNMCTDEHGNTYAEPDVYLSDDTGYKGFEDLKYFEKVGR